MTDDRVSDLQAQVDALREALRDIFRTEYRPSEQAEAFSRARALLAQETPEETQSL